MLGLMVLLSASLIAQEQAGPPPPSATSPPPATVPQPPSPDPASAAEAKALAEYNGLREKTPETAAAQWKLAAWCEAAGLKPESYVHFGRVVELDPSRELAWQKLGFKKHGSQWMTDDQVRAQDAQQKANKDWSLKLKKWHQAVHGPKQRIKPEEAIAGLDALTDPTAAPSIYREFAGGSSKDQDMAVRLLGQVESPIASKGLAMLAVYGKHPDVRRAATETLRSRPTSEYLDLLVAMMKDPLRHEVRPVGGPGSPGILVVEGDQFNVQRIYAPPPPPGFNLQLGDQVSWDEYGNPVISRTRTLGSSVTGMVGVKGSKNLVNETGVYTNEIETFSYSNAILEARRGAYYAQVQLQADLARLGAINDQRKALTDRVMAVARGATGKDLGLTAKDWKKAIQSTDGRYARKPNRPEGKATVDELVPLDYVPDLASILATRLQTSTFKGTIVDS